MSIKSKQGKERRQDARCRSFNLIHILDPKTGEPFLVNSTLVNISSGGMCLYSSMPMKAKERMRLKIEIKEFNATVDAYGSVVWVQKSTEHTGSYLMGVQFIGIKENERDVIRRLQKVSKETGE